eukprot:6180241-Pleurochrysis_carterae.AAC.2
MRDRCEKAKEEKGRDEPVHQRARRCKGAHEGARASVTPCAVTRQTAEAEAKGGESSEREKSGELEEKGK